MRRSKSNPAKYARNYRRISQRKMTEFDHLDEEKEIQRLKNILKHSKDHLKHVRDSDDDSEDNDDDGTKKKNSTKRAKKMEDDESAGDSSFLDNAQKKDKEQQLQLESKQATLSKSTKMKDDDEDAAFERARELLRNSNAHLQQNHLSINKSSNDDDDDDDDSNNKLDNAQSQQSSQERKGKKRSRQEEQEQSVEDNSNSNKKSNPQRETTSDGISKNKDDTKNSSTTAEILLSDELLAEQQQQQQQQQGHGVDTDNTEFVILPSSKKKKKSSNKKPKVELTPEEIKQAKQLKKKTERKLKQLSLRAEQKKKRSELYEKLQKTAISEEEMQLMSSSSTLGKRVSKKELLKKLIQKERAGIALTEDEKQILYRDRGGGADADGSASEDGDQERKEPSSAKELSEMSEHKGKNDEEGSASKTTKQNIATKHKAKDATDNDGDSDREVKQEKSDATKADKKEGKPAGDASSFAAQMMASLSKLKVVSELQKEELQKEEAEEEEQKRLEQERKLKAAKGAPYKVKNPVKIQTAATNKNLPVHQLPAGNRRILTIARPEAVQESRYDLPVTQMEYEVMDAVRNNDVTVVCGETGSGKSTQIPQLLYESGFSLGSSPGSTSSSQDNKSTQELEHKFLIGITQPRRVAAVSTAKRVCYEMGHGDGQTIKSSNKRKDGNPVAYQTRYETAGLGDKTRVKFMTDGILLQEIQSDLLLRKYSVIVLDECHERNLNCDILCGLIGLALPLRKKASEEPGSSIAPLKLVIMSATLRVDDFVSNSKLFPSTKPFVVKIPGRTFPVTIHHSRETELVDYEDAAFRKICKIHRKLPQGGILVFLTGKQEIVRMVKKLRKALSPQKQKKKMHKLDDSELLGVNDVAASRTDIAYSDDTGPRDLDDDEIDGDFFQNDDEDDFDDDYDNDSEVVIPYGSPSDEEDDNNMPKDIMVLPLYSLMSTEEQAKVFAAVPDGKRLIVCATNIAETSITIPNISYVVDTGRQKTKSYDAKTGVASFDVSWISKAAANQRAGRAGRTGPGHCYRLYSSSMFSRHMDDFALPEVLTRPLEDVVLAMKAMKISSVSKFPFPTPPAQGQIDAAVKLLANLGCVELSEYDLEGDGQVTRLGSAISTFPLGVRCGKMLLVAAHAGVLDYAIAIVAAFSEKNPFVRGGEQDVGQGDELEGHSSDNPDNKSASQKKTKCKHWVHKAGDIYAVMLAIGAYTYAGRGAGGVSEKVACEQFCADNGLNPVIMERIQKIRMHLSRLVKTRMAGAEGVAAKTGRIPHTMKPPNKVQEQLLMQVIVSGLLDNVAMLAPLGTIPGNHPFSLRSAYMSCSTSIKEPLFMDRNSVLYSRDSRLLPQWVCYDYIVRKSLKDGTSIATMKNVTPVDTAYLGTLAKGSHLLTLGGPLFTPRPAYDSEKDEVVCAVETKYGNHGWEITPVKMRMRDALKKPKANFRPDDNFRYFARFLLEGKIIPKLRELGPLLNDSPSIVTSNTPVAKVGLIVSALSNADIDSASSLSRYWAEVDNKFLFKNLKGWVRPECASTAKSIWISAVKQTVGTSKT